MLSLMQGDELIAHIRYKMPSAAIGPGMEYVYCRRHWNLWEYMARPVRSCSKCRTKMVKRINLNSPDSTVVILTRFLGKGIWPTHLESDLFTFWPVLTRVLIECVPLLPLPWLGIRDR